MDLDIFTPLGFVNLKGICIRCDNITMIEDYNGSTKIYSKHGLDIVISKPYDDVCRAIYQAQERASIRSKN